MCPVALIALLDFTGLPGGRITESHRIREGWNSHLNNMKLMRTGLHLLNRTVYFIIRSLSVVIHFKMKSINRISSFSNLESCYSCQEKEDITKSKNQVNLFHFL